MIMKIIAWNINGIRSSMKENDLYNLIKTEKPDIICFGETKISCPFEEVQQELKEKIKGYKYRYWSPCLIKNGYSGTAIFSKKKPLDIMYGMKNNKDEKNLDEEGRMITLEFEKFYLLHVYTPNSGEELVRLTYRTKTWDVAFRNYITELQKIKPVIVCGDLNVANEPIDLHDPIHNKKTAGFTIEERDSFKKLINELDIIDTYRYLNPNKIEYSYWSYRRRARENNKGWRIDYFLVSSNLLKKVNISSILTDVMGSDHAPVMIQIKI